MGIKTEKTTLKDVVLIKPGIFEDHRGAYVETYNVEDYNKNGLEQNFVRDDISTSSRHVLRGIHYDDKTWKLIDCMYGKIYFLVIDMRKGSPEYLKWEAFNLTSGNRHQVLVPPGYGNGHLVLSDECIFHYKMSEYYDAPNEKCLRWDDPKAKIYWPIKTPILSFKDANAKFID